MEQENNLNQSDLGMGVKKEQKKTNGFKIGIAVLIVAILAVGVFAAPKIVQAVRKMTMSPAEYYQYVETKNRDKGEELMFGYYDAIRESLTGDSYAKSANMKIELSDTAKSLLSMVGVDFSGLKNLEVDMLTGKQDTALSTQMKLRGNDNDLLTIKTYMDSEKKEAYYQIPELGKAYLDMSAMYDGMGTEGKDGVAVNQLLGSLTYNYDDLLVETDTLKEIYERYTDILIQSAKNVEKSEGGCKAEGISQEADKYTVTLDGQELSKLAEEFLKALKSDKAIKKMIEASAEDAYQEFTNSIDEALEELNSGVEKDALKAVQEAQISSDETIIGRKLTIEADGQKVFGISFAFPQEDEKFGCEFVVTDENEAEIFKLYGKGTLEAGVLNGELTLGLDDSVLNSEEVATAVSLEKLLKIEYKDYDMSKLDEGKAKGTVIYSTEAVAELANYSLKVESEGDMEESTGKITILAGKEEFLTIDVEAKSDVKMESIKPSEDDIIYDIENEEDMSQYESEMDVEQLLTDIQEKLNVDLSSLLGGLMSGASSDVGSLEDDSDLSYSDLEG